MRSGTRDKVSVGSNQYLRDMFLPGPGLLTSVFGVAPSLYYRPGDVASGNIPNKMASSGSPAAVPDGTRDYGKTLIGTEVQGIRGTVGTNDGWYVTDNTMSPGTDSYITVCCFSLDTTPVGSDNQCVFCLVESSGAKYVMTRFTTTGAINWLTRDGTNTKNLSLGANTGGARKSYMVIGGYDQTNFFMCLSSTDTQPGGQNVVASVAKGAWVGFGAPVAFQVRFTNYAPSTNSQDWRVGMAAYMKGSALNNIFTDSNIKRIMGCLGWR